MDLDRARCGAYAPPSAPRAAGQAEPVPAENPLYFVSAVEPVPPFPRLLGESRLCFVPEGATKQNSGRTKPFCRLAKASGNRCWLTIQPTKRRGQQKGP